MSGKRKAETIVDENEAKQTKVEEVSAKTDENGGSVSPNEHEKSQETETSNEFEVKKVILLTKFKFIMKIIFNLNKIIFPFVSF